jgi:hypothetical protein
VKSDEDYKNRIIQSSYTDINTASPEEQAQNLIMFQSSQFQKKFRELIRQPETIDLLLKLVKQKYNIDGIMYINNVFPYVKTEFIKMFGQYPLKPNAQNIFVFLENLLAGKQETKEMFKEVKKEAKEEKALDDLLVR